MSWVLKLSVSFVFATVTLFAAPKTPVQIAEQIVGLEMPVEGETTVMRDRVLAAKSAELEAAVPIFIQWLKEPENQRSEALFATLELLATSHAGFTPAMAKSVFPWVRSNRSLHWRKETAEGALAKRGDLVTPKYVKEKLAAVSNPSVGGPLRLAIMGSIINMDAKPETDQLLKLLRSDRDQLRKESVVWFAMQPPKSAAERVRFLKAAFVAQPLPVRQTAYSIVLAWSDQDRSAIQKALPACAKESVADVRALCEKVKQ